MAKQSDGRKFLSTGHLSDRVWMDSSRTRPVCEKGQRSTRDSGMVSMENRYGLVPPQTGRRKRHAEEGTLGGRYTEVKRNADNAQWNDSQKMNLFDSQDLESISSDSDSQEVRPGWPPEDMGADSTRCKQSFSEKERQGLQLLSPAVRGKIIKLQRDLEKAKAESRYLRAQPVDSPGVDVSAVRFTRTPVPRYDGISDWEQYREVYEAIVISNGWDVLTAALQLLAHLDGEALNVALLVPEDQRRRPGVLIESLTAHYTSPGRLSQRRRQFEQMTRPVGEDPAVFAIALETLARRAFVEVDPSVRLQLVRDKLITGQPQLALRRHLDSAEPDTPMVDIVDKCRVWESHAELRGRPENQCEPGTSRGVFQVREQVRDNKKEETVTEPDSNYSKLGNLTDRLRELVKQPSPAGSRPVDIGQLLRQLMPVEDEANEIGQPMSGAESADNCMSGNAV